MSSIAALAIESNWAPDPRKLPKGERARELATAPATDKGERGRAAIGSSRTRPFTCFGHRLANPRASNDPTECPRSNTCLLLLCFTCIARKSMIWSWSNRLVPGTFRTKMLKLSLSCCSSIRDGRVEPSRPGRQINAGRSSALLDSESRCHGARSSRNSLVFCFKPLLLTAEMSSRF